MAKRRPKRSASSASSLMAHLPSAVSGAGSVLNSVRLRLFIKRLLDRQNETRECRIKAQSESGKTSPNLKRIKLAELSQRQRQRQQHQAEQQQIQKQQQQLSLRASLARSNWLTKRMMINLIVCSALTWLAWPVEGQQRPESRASNSLPTVIVRGFLNYRTTVDGTVLLFTPDAGMGSSSAVQSISATPTPALGLRTDQATYSESSFSLPASPSRVEYSDAPSNDPWRPIQPTPTAGEPIMRTAPPIVGRQDLELLSEPPANLMISESPVAAENALGQKPTQAAPTVQAEDVLAGTSGLDQAAQRTQSTAATAADLPGRLPSSGRPKRPALGFNGQGLRGSNGRLAGNGRASQGSGQAEAQQSSNTINGIRRPGTSATLAQAAAAAAAAASSSEAAANVNSAAFQSRLAAAKLRNRFKKPPSGVTPASNLNQAAESGDKLAAVQLKTSINPDTPTATPSSSSTEDPQTLDVIATATAASLTLASSPTSANEPHDSVPSSSSTSAPPTAAGSVSEITDAGVLLQSVPSSPELAGSQAMLASSGLGEASLEPMGELSNMKPISRSGEQRPAQLASGELSTTDLQHGQLSNVPFNLDSFFQSDQPSAESSNSNTQTADGQHSSGFVPPKPAKSSNNDKLTGWMDQHNSNKYVPRPAAGQHSHKAEPGHLSQQLAAVMPSFAAPNIAPSAALAKPTAILASQSAKPRVGANPDELGTSTTISSSADGSAGKPSSEETPGSQAENLPESKQEDEQAGLQMQTITKTYSTVQKSTKTRLVPLQVKSSTAIHTITEHYVVTKMMTAYQTMPVGEFILPEPAVSGNKSPFDMFNDLDSSQQASDTKARAGEQPISAASTGSVSSEPASNQQVEQPISLDTSPKSANDWLHDFNNPSANNQQGNSNQQQQQQQQQDLASLLEQQAQQANLGNFMGFGGSEPLDQLASTNQLDPTALLADGTLTIPDLNNPLVLAAAIQNPQLAAVILAAQQLQLKQRQAKLNANGQTNNNNNNNNNNNVNAAQQIQAQQLQPSYSTSFSTLIKPTTYTVRDTMYTTRLVSFKDGRTVRTRTVSEPGSVIEQVLTTMATEVTPVTITIRPTGVLNLGLATAAPGSGQSNGGAQTTLNNALLATQLASILARRQQQVQPGLSNSAFLAAATNAINQQNQQQQNQQQQQLPLNQLAALQQLINQQQQRPQVAKQFQPNLQQMLQSMQQQQQSPVATANSLSSLASSLPAPSQPNGGANQSAGQGAEQKRANQAPPEPSIGANQVQPTPILPPLLGPLTTTITNLQVRTYTVHNAFKTIFRTITSTQLLTSTIYPNGVARATQMPTIG